MAFKYVKLLLPHPMPLQNCVMAGGWKIGLRREELDVAPGMPLGTVYLLALISPNGKHSWAFSYHRPIPVPSVS